MHIIQKKLILKWSIFYIDANYLLVIVPNHKTKTYVSAIRYFESVKMYTYFMKLKSVTRSLLI